MSASTRKIPKLRQDLKVSRQVLSEKVKFVVKDPLKGEYYGFTQNEWRIIELFDGQREIQEMVQFFNDQYPHDPIDADVIKEFEKSLTSMHLLEKTSQEMNVMLIEKMKESRQSLLLSKKGSLMYKRFPVVDPDKFFDRVIPHITFFWSRKFLLISIITMMLCLLLVAMRFDEFHNGVFEVFAFSKLSFWNITFLWFTIYTVIAIHELGHGLTCKYYGGEVHEIGFLLLFFQPCLYANVNDAWLFDKKWKQVMVTIAGGYIEFFVGALFGILWALTNPNTLINVLSLQVMTICSLSTVMFNFNPLVKLDGYYLLADFLETPNLRESSFEYLQYFVKRWIFRMDVEVPEGSVRERRIYLLYGVAAFFWVSSLTLGLFTMAKGFLIDHLHAFGILISFWVAYKLFGGHVKSSFKFLLQLGINHRVFLISRRGKIWGSSIAVGLLVLIFFPINYSVRGKCELESFSSEMVRARTSGIIKRFLAADGDVVSSGQKLFEMENPSLLTDAEIAKLAIEKLDLQTRGAIKSDPLRLTSLHEQLKARKEAYAQILQKIQLLQPEVGVLNGTTVAHCSDFVRRTNTFVREGTEICRLESLDQLKAVIEVPENEVRFISEGDKVLFKLQAKPLDTYIGHVTRIRDMGIPDPLNSKARLYLGELIIKNSGELRPGMTGQAKVLTGSIPAIQYFGRRMATFFRLDLFY